MLSLFGLGGSRKKSCKRTRRKSCKSRKNSKRCSCRKKSNVQEEIVPENQDVQ